MSTSNIATAKRLYDEVWNQQKLSVLDEIFAEDFVIYAPGVEVTDLLMLKDFISGWLQAFPDIQHTVEDCFEAGEKLALRFSGCGTHQNDFVDIPASNKQWHYSGMNIMHFEQGRISKLWLNSSMLELIEQLKSTE